MLTKRWKIKPPGNPETVNRLQEELKINFIIANLLVQRGINNYEEAKKFFRPSLSDLHDPFLMKDMDKAVARIEKAVRQRRKILVYGDYDVDGTTAVALVYSFLTSNIKHQTSNIDFYIPDRYKEGYGISTAGIDFAAENNFSLIIALDCGIKSADKIRYAKEKGIDFIICDHHLPGDELPDAVAALDPQRSDCPYPYKELSGCGIGFKLVQALSTLPHFHTFSPSPESYLDLVAISIASDIVPITGENRILTYFGLQKLNASPRKGIRALLEVSGLKKEIGVNEIVFGIGPRINAAGRMESGRKAVELFLSSSDEDAGTGGQELNKNNISRREIDMDTTREALQRISENPVLRQRKSTVLFDPNWHKGVIGIVASRLTETYYRPTVLLTQSDGMICGSARSIKDFDLYEAISRCSDLLEQFGGHKFAAGLMLKPENVEAFSERFEQVVTSMITDEMLIPEIEIDAVINFSDITPSFCRIIKQFAPFGPGNLSPVFLTENVCDNGSARIVGKNHLKMEMASFPAIGFGMEEYYGIVSAKKPFSACYNIDEREYNGKKYLQLLVKDIHPANYELSR